MMIRKFLSSLFRFAYQVSFYKNGKVVVWVTSRDNIKLVTDIMVAHGYKFVGTKQLRGNKFVISYIGDVRD